METNEEFLYFLNKCCQKEKDSWELFVEKYSKLIYNYIIKTLNKYYFISQNDEVDEIYNRIFIALLDRDCRRLRNFRGKNERSFIAYLREISFHLTIDFLREQKSSVGLDQIKHHVYDDDKLEKLRKDELKDVIKVIRDELPARHAYLFRLLYEEELDLMEIADMMNLKLNAAHQLKFRMIMNFIKIAREKELYDELKKFISDS